MCIKRGIECVYRGNLNIIFVDPTESRGKKSSLTPEPVDSGYVSLGDFNGSNDGIFEMPQSALAMINRSQLQGSFLCEFLPSSAKSTTILPSLVDGARQTSWLYQAYDIAMADELLSDSLHALTLAHFNRRGIADVSNNDCRSAYGKAMRSLGKRLSQPDRVFEDSTLAATMTLISYEAETARSDAPLRWFDHVRGVLALVDARGKRNFATDFAQQLFDATRIFEIINCLATRKAVDQAGLALQSSNSATKDFYSQLCGILQSMPSMLELGDAIRRDMDALSDQELRNKVSTLAYTFQDFDARLDSWQARLEMDYSNQHGVSQPIMWDEPSQLAATLDLDDPARIYTTYICFSSLDIAQCMIYKWSCLLLINCFCVITEGALRARGPTITIHGTDEERNAMNAKTFKLADNITKSLEYFLHPDCGLVAMDILGYPINVSYGYWNVSGAKQKLWFRVVLKRLKEISPGFGGMLETMANLGGGAKGFREFFLGETGVSNVPADSRVRNT